MVTENCKKIEPVVVKLRWKQNIPFFSEHGVCTRDRYDHEVSILSKSNSGLTGYSCHFLKASLHYYVKHKSLKMLQLLYQFLMTKLCQTVMITLWKTHSANLEHCFTASMTAHSISILSELKISSFGLYAGAKTRSPSIAVSTALCWRPCHCPTVPQRRELAIGTRAAGQGSK